MKKVTITKPDGKQGILSLASDGKWDIEVGDKQAPANLHYTTDQVEKIVASARARGEIVTIET